MLGGTYELCAEGHLNRTDIAALMGEVLGRKIEAAKIDPNQVAQGQGDEGQRLKKMFFWYDEHGLLGNSLTLRAILGREPRTLRDYLTELANAK